MAQRLLTVAGLGPRCSTNERDEAASAVSGVPESGCSDCEPGSDREYSVVSILSHSVAEQWWGYDSDPSNQPHQSYPRRHNQPPDPCGFATFIHRAPGRSGPGHPEVLGGGGDGG